MELSDVLRELSHGRNIVISHYTNVMLKLLFLTVLEAVEDKRRVIVVDEHDYVARFIPLELAERIQITHSVEEACGEREVFVVVFMPKYLRRILHCRAEDALVFTKPTRMLQPGEYVKYYVGKVAEEEYVLKSPLKGIAIRLKVRGDSVEVFEKPPGILAQVLEILKNIASTYGDVTVKDAVVIIAKETGVDRRQARSILIKLARKGYIRVQKGKIQLA
jgi:hypothetical protein